MYSASVLGQCLGLRWEKWKQQATSYMWPFGMLVFLYPRSFQENPISAVRQNLLARTNMTGGLCGLQCRAYTCWRIFQHYRLIVHTCRSSSWDVSFPFHRSGCILNPVSSGRCHIRYTISVWPTRFKTHFWVRGRYVSLKRNSWDFISIIEAHTVNTVHVWTGL